MPGTPVPGTAAACPLRRAGGSFTGSQCWYRLQGNRCSICASEPVGGGCDPWITLPPPGMYNVYIPRHVYSPHVFLAPWTFGPSPHAPRLLSPGHAAMARQHCSGLRAGYWGSEGLQLRLHGLATSAVRATGCARTCVSRHLEAAPSAWSASRHCARPGAPQLLKSAPGCGSDRTQSF